MSVFYVIIVSNLYQKRKEVSLQIYILYTKSNVQIYEGDNSNYMQIFKSISRTLSILILVYILCLTPMVCFQFGSDTPSFTPWPPQSKFSLYMFYIYDFGWSIHSEINISLIFFCFRVFWLFAINALVYLATNSRIREAYRIFLKDMWKKIFKKNHQTLDHNLTDTSAFWIGLRKIQVEREWKSWSSKSKSLNCRNTYL